MIIARSLEELQSAVDAIKANGKTIGFVPTMGALHDGHLSLMRLAAAHADIVSVSIYVNPTQFAPNEDFDSYPRDVDGDIAKLRSVGVGLVYLPRTEDMYPNGAEITVKAGKSAQGLESDFRPHFFDGVATVVHRLFTQMRPDVAVFGQKDFQQLQVIKEMAAAEHPKIQIIGGDTARDHEGLALSSRNAYLSDSEITSARLLNRVLHDVAAANENDRAAVINRGMAQLRAAGFETIDYLASHDEGQRVLVAAWLGKTRLIDNIALAR